ncbi:TonB family protein [Coraliomargarita akajimensis DSM 45221]|uniref:TonB family protein n=2 Tax=Coraliomargarita TaxID=442430 RepID=D5EM94_CORAD|nr:TonB family protein [Coraliomargarita akajimensis DSM 45221]
MYSGFGRSLLMGGLIAFGIFMLIPITQFFEPEPSEVQELQEAVLAPPPPPPPKVDPPPPPPPEDREPPPELNQPKPLPSLEQLEVALNPGTGGVGVEMKMDFEVRTESVQEMMDIFEFGDLDEAPRILREGRWRFPPNFRKERGSGYVRVEIYVNPDGSVEVQKVLDYSHSEFIRSVKQLAETTRFSAPMKNGGPVKAKYKWRIEFPLN